MMFQDCVPVIGLTSPESMMRQTKGGAEITVCQELFRQDSIFAQRARARPS